MHAVVNQMKLAKPIPDELFARMQNELTQDSKKIPGFQEAFCVRPGADHLIMVVLCDSASAVEQLHKEVGGPWIGANIRPYVESVDRRVGEVVAGSRF